MKKEEEIKAEVIKEIEEAVEKSYTPEIMERLMKGEEVTVNNLTIRMPLFTKK